MGDRKTLRDLRNQVRPPKVTQTLLQKKRDGIAELEGLTADSFEQLTTWVNAVISGNVAVPEWQSEDDKRSWRQFLFRFEHREHSNWMRHEFQLQ